MRQEVQVFTVKVGYIDIQKQIIPRSGTFDTNKTNKFIE